MTTLDISSFPISTSTLKSLQDNGFKYSEDLKGLSISQLSRECNISHQEAMQVLDYANGKSSSSKIVTQHALDLFVVQKPSIVTLCREIDEILGTGGIPLGTLTEFCGMPGIGKTQIGIQLTVNVQVPKALAGVEGKAIYLDTEGSFRPERVEQIANSFLTELKDSNPKVFEKMTVDVILKNIFYYRLHSYLEQISIINILPSFLSLNPEIKLIVIDSIAFHFRSGFEDMAQRTRILQGMGKNLSIIASQFDVAIVIMNQVTTKWDKQKKTTLSPALGESWSHVCSNRLFLSREDKTRRVCTLFKSPSQKESTVGYQITEAGLRSESKKRVLGNLDEDDSKYSKIDDDLDD